MGILLRIAKQLESHADAAERLHQATESMLKMWGRVVDRPSRESRQPTVEDLRRTALGEFLRRNVERNPASLGHMTDAQRAILREMEE